MIVGLILICFGVIVILHPEILAFMFGGFLIMIGLGILAAAWRFRRMGGSSTSVATKWFLRF